MSWPKVKVLTSLGKMHQRKRSGIHWATGRPPGLKAAWVSGGGVSESSSCAVGARIWMQTGEPVVWSRATPTAAT